MSGSAENIASLKSYLTYLKADGGSNFEAGFNMAFNLLYESGVTNYDLDTIDGVRCVNK